MLENKKLSIANFNCTFGKDNEPMLEHFEDIILPAFQQDIIRENKGSTYFFENIKILMTKGEFVLAGLLIKRTKLEVKSIYREGEGLTRTHEIYPSDPYSYFLINLKNHRMVLVKNQKGSPTLANFSSTSKHLLQSYIRLYNEKVNDKEEKLPSVHLNIVAIPFEGVIKEELKKVAKIQNVTLRFYPLNGDISNNDTFIHLTEILDDVESGSGSVQINTPDNKNKVAEILDDTKGLVKPSIRVKYKDGSRKTLKDDSFTEEMDISLDDDESFDENIDNIAGKVINKQEFNEISEGNKRIYDKFFGAIEKLYYKYLSK
ncbi:hypothetical protein [Alkalihalobacillus sp. BA299]|uniref:hypothetical protein n=1 Tax=Alkalihalobacillus sp. BA299 TaxID=2815938 RepID=UPI001ADD5245|nr:hypothetical protein [Alkalihalobacillus sp. BA299]